MKEDESVCKPLHQKTRSTLPNGPNYRSQSAGKLPNSKSRTNSGSGPDLTVSSSRVVNKLHTRIHHVGKIMKFVN